MRFIQLVVLDMTNIPNQLVLFLCINVEGVAKRVIDIWVFMSMGSFCFSHMIYCYYTSMNSNNRCCRVVSMDKIFLIINAHSPPRKNDDDSSHQ